MTITLDDGQKVQVMICDEHAEEATIKSARQAYQSKMDKFKELLEQAKALGLDLSVVQPGVGQPVQNATQAVQQPVVQAAVIEKPKPKPVTPVIEFEDQDNVVDTSLIDRGRPFISTGGQTEYGAVQGYSNYDLNSGSDKLLPELRQGKAHMAMVEGRAGQPIVIPDKRIDGTGTTTIKIIKAESDATLQNRFKRMAGDSLNDKGPDFAHAGYVDGVKDCPFCRGQGSIKNGQKLIECPKCRGSGMLAV